MDEISVIKELLNAEIKGLKIQLDSEFKVLNERLNSTNTILSRVEEQTKKTNGRVTSLEDQGSDHYKDCPNTTKIEEMHEDLSEYRLFKKYPKLAVGIVAIACIVTIIGAYIMISDFTEQAKEQIQRELQSK